MLRPHEDTYGRIIYDHLRGLPTQEIVERDDGFVAVSGGAPAYFAPFRRWPRYQRQAMRFARGRVLDVGCGAGRCALHLQARGCSVLGIDSSPLAIRTCRLRGVRRARVLPFARVSARLGRFDAVVMLGNNFGLFGDAARARRLLRRLHRITSDDARILADARDPYATTLRHHRDYQRWNRRRGRLPGQLRLRVRYATYCTPWFDYLLVSPAEMQAMLRATGWRAARRLPGPGGSYLTVIAKEAGSPARRAGAQARRDGT